MFVDEVAHEPRRAQGGALLPPERVGWCKVQVVFLRGRYVIQAFVLEPELGGVGKQKLSVELQLVSKGGIVRQDGLSVKKANH